MKHYFVFLLALTLVACDSSDKQAEQRSVQQATAVHAPAQPMENAAAAKPAQNDGERLAKELILIDTHIDTPSRLNSKQQDISQATEGQFDYPKAVAGGLDVAFMSIYIPAEVEEAGEAKKLAEKLISMVEGIVADAPDKFALAMSSHEVEENFDEGKVSLAMGMENGGPMEGDIANVQYFYDKGIRYITLTHAKSNHISDSSYDENRQWNGLSEFGKKLVIEMNRVGIMVDISHVSDEAFYQVMELSEVPAIASHSSARHFTPGFERNMDDDMIKRLAENGGVIQINFGSTFVNEKSRKEADAMGTQIKKHFEENKIELGSDETEAYIKKYREENPFPFASLDDVLDHFDHVVELVSIEHVGIGSDYDGVGDTLPVGLKDVSQFPNLVNGLLNRGYSEEDIEKVLGGNLLRVWQEVESYALSQSDEEEE